MRIAFVLLDEAWSGGVQYLFNLMSALADLPGRPVAPSLLLGPGVSDRTAARFRAFLSEPPVRCPDEAIRDARLPVLPLLQLRAEALEKLLKARDVDLLFHHGLILGSRMAVPALSWIPDFQHRRLPRMFGATRFLRREIFFQLMIGESSHLMVSSEASRRDCEDLYARSRGRVSVVPFAITPLAPALAASPETLRGRYGLPDRFLFMPNQVWRHKNHLAVVEALRMLDDGSTVVSTGSLLDARDPRHPEEVLARIRTHGLEDRFRVLGQVPHEDVLGLLLASDGLINPSLFEGWSTAVEEAKSYGVRLFLSGLDVHREQAGRETVYFDPHAPESIAEAIHAAFASDPQKRDPLRAVEAYEENRLRFARAFFHLACRCVEERG